MNKNLDSEILSLKDQKFLEEMANNILAPINGSVVIDPEPTKIMWWSLDGGRKSEWDEYIYRIRVTSDLGDCHFAENINLKMLPDVAWGIASQVFTRLDGDIHGKLSNNLWPKNNDWKPDYLRFTPKEE